MLTVRAATKADVAGIRALYEGLSAEDSHRRFFAAIRVTDALVRTWVERCRDGGLGLVAVVDDGEASSRVVADAGYVLQPNGDGEFALTVAADRRGWLGPYLLDVLVEAAAERGVRNLEADILTENRVMLSLVRRRGYVTDGDTDFLVVHVVIGTEGHGPVWPSKPHGRKLLVEKPGGRWEGRQRAPPRRLRRARVRLPRGLSRPARPALPARRRGRRHRRRLSRRRHPGPQAAPSARALAQQCSDRCHPLPDRGSSRNRLPARVGQPERGLEGTAGRGTRRRLIHRPPLKGQTIPACRPDRPVA